MKFRIYKKISPIKVQPRNGWIYDKIASTFDENLLTVPGYRKPLNQIYSFDP